MKNIILALGMVALASALIHAEAVTEDDEYKDFDKLHRKLVRMKKEMDSLMTDIVATPPQAGSAITGFGQDVKIDVSEDAANIIIRADLPGMEKDKIDVTLERNRFLKISGTREMEKRETTPGVIKQERSLGKFERVIELPIECKNMGIEANYKNGVLEMVIPKKEMKQAEKVKIDVR